MLFSLQKIGLQMKKRIALFLALILMMGLTLQANAAGSDDGVLYNCVIAVGCGSNGVVISFETNSTIKAKEIGCKDIVLMEKNGNTWTQININGGSENDFYSYGGSATYTGAVKGRTYYAYCTHYANYGDTTRSVYNYTNEMVYN